MDIKSWSTEGEFAADYRELIFTNPAIEDFLNGQSKFILVASKGMGKTLLMRLKRDRVHNGNPSIIMIPQHDQQADYVTLPGSYEQGILELMATSEFWEYIWTLSIQISALLHFPHSLSDEQKATVRADLRHLGSDLPPDIVVALEGALCEGRRAFRAPSTILSRLLSNTRSKLERLERLAPPVFHDLMHHVNSGCYVFIDSFDQALEDFHQINLDIWAAGQRGLLRSAWNISRHNHHIKVYATIRQEAYASFSGQDAMKMRGSILLLEYSKDDLRALLEKLIFHYEEITDLLKFVGLDSVFNQYVKRREEVFDYVHRHLIDVPRWYASLGSELSEERRTPRYRNSPEDAFRNIVNRVSAKLAEEYLAKEMKLFFRNVDPTDMVHELFSRMRSTVFSFDNVDYLARLFSQVCEWKHPFSLLYNLGLFGFVQQAAAAPKRYQYFKRPYQFAWSDNNILPEDRQGIYLLHPALHAFMRDKNLSAQYCPVLIGDGIQWTKKEDEVVRRETIRVFVSYSHADNGIVEPIVRLMHGYFEESLALFHIWFDQWSMEPGRPVHEQLKDALNECDFLVLMISESSVKSKFVGLEWEKKFFESFYDKDNHNADRVLPVYLGNTITKLPDFIRPIFAVSYAGVRDEHSIKKLVDRMLSSHRKVRTAGQQ
jgi:TIR domain